jgi:hypothetical protein
MRLRLAEGATVGRMKPNIDDEQQFISGRSALMAVHYKIYSWLTRIT